MNYFGAANGVRALNPYESQQRALSDGILWVTLGRSRASGRIAAGPAAATRPASW
jgi:hypothetical protein